MAETKKSQEDLKKQQGESEPNTVQKAPEVQMIPVTDVARIVKEEVDKALSEINNQKGEPKKQEDQKILNLTNIDDIPEFDEFEYKDRVYILCDGTRPASWNIRSKHTKYNELQYTHPKTLVRHSLRYATNQPSIFMDKQVGDVLTAHITIEDGFLKVPKEQTSLQKFLHIHPDNGTVFKELDERKESLEILEKEQILYNALKIVNEEPYKTLEIIARVFLPYFSEYWNSDIVKKELALGAKQNPSRLIKISKDPYLLEKGMAQIAINRGNLIYNNQRFSTANGDFILDVPRGEDKYDAIGKFFKSDNGKSYFEYYKSLL
jgi:hypothetical protein